MIFNNIFKDIALKNSASEVLRLGMSREFTDITDSSNTSTNFINAPRGQVRPRIIFHQIYTNFSTKTIGFSKKLKMGLCSSKFLDYKEKVNRMLLLPDNISSITADGININNLLNTLFCSKLSYRSLAVNYLINKNILTQDDYNSSLEFINFNELELNNFITTYENSTYTMKYINTAIKLETRYNNSFDDLFIVKFLNYSYYLNTELNYNTYYINVHVEGIGASRNDWYYNESGYDQTITTTSISGKIQTGYFAWSISNVGEGGDVELDHIDLIDYIDNLVLKLKIPNSF